MRPSAQPTPSNPETEASRLPLLISYLEDSRARIAATKARCWDVFKWTASMNLLLASVAAATQARPRVFLLAVAVCALIGATLLWHFTQRLARARQFEHRIARHLNNTVFDVTMVTITGWRSARNHRDNDRYELFGFWLGIVLSLLPMLGAAIIAR